MSTTASTMPPRNAAMNQSPTSVSAYSPGTPGAPRAGPKPLSCTSCRQRKVKCNKVHPCGPCQKSGIQCVFPQRVRVPRGKQGGSKARDSELLRRIGRLESLVSRVDAAKASLEHHEASSDEADADAELLSRTHPLAGNGEIDDLSLKEGYDVLVQLQERGNSYLSSQFWSTMGDEVEGLRGLLEQSQDDEDDGMDESNSTPSSSSIIQHSPSFIFGDTMAAQQVETQHPSHPHRTILIQRYFSSVHICCQVLHKKTVMDQLFHNNGNLFDETRKHYRFRSMEAMAFSMYFAATTSMSDEECIKCFGEERDVLLSRYKHGVEVSLTKADFLNSMEIITLTAFVLYLVAARSSNVTRSTWTLLGLAVRIAHSLGIHLDGDGRQFSAFEAEMRRRLWWQIIILDMRASEDRGSESIIGHGTFNTAMPCNLNDDELSLTSKHPLPDRKGTTEMFHMLIAAEAANALRRSNFISPNREDGGMTLQEKESIIKESIAKIENNYTDGIDVDSPDSPIASVLGRVFTLRLWAVLQYPFQKRKHDAAVVWPEGAALRTAISILELVQLLEVQGEAQGILWFHKTWVPWHPVAMALAELCKSPHGALADRAWPIVETGFKTCSERVADSKEGMLWKPIKKLYKRAQAVRMGKPRPSSEVSSTPASLVSVTPRASIDTAIDRAQSDFHGSTPLTNGSINMVGNLPPIPGTEDTYHTPAPTNLSSTYDYPQPPIFSPFSTLDWMPPTDFIMSGTEPYGCPIDWNDWNDFVFEANTGQAVQQPRNAYAGQSAMMTSPNTFFDWGQMQQP